ncbi:hypothetical protein [Streptomyces cacaoi]|uniref:hypothetical protein n=1 Tax=Streptomyces cacaoi TaxID=1898 RepID=UPI00261D4CDB|nr:hypothetical protein [Streptomyces cacaoi]
MNHSAACGAAGNPHGKPAAPGQIIVIVIVLLLSLTAAAYGQPVPETAIEILTAAVAALLAPRDR